MLIKQLHLLGTDSSHVPLTDYKLPLTTSFHGTFQAQYKRRFYNGHPAPPPLWTDRNFLVHNVLCVCHFLQDVSIAVADNCNWLVDIPVPE